MNIFVFIVCDDSMLINNSSCGKIFIWKGEASWNLMSSLCQYVHSVVGPKNMITVKDGARCDSLITFSRLSK